MSRPAAYLKPEKSQILLVFWRHARTSMNASRLLQGKASDTELDEVGIQQARSVGRHIREKYAPDMVFSSPLKRTQQTLAVGGFTDIPIQLDPRLMEMDYGKLEGHLAADFTEEISQWSKDPSIRFSTGESLQELFERVSLACEEIPTQDLEGKCLLVCSHATPIKAAIVWALGGNAEMIMKMQINLASVSLVAKTKYGKIVMSYNETLEGK